MVALPGSWELTVWLQGTNENQVSVNVIVVALFNMYVYTRTHNCPFLITHIYFK